MHNDEWNDERIRSYFYLVSLPLIFIVIFSILFLFSTSWSIFDDLLGFRDNKALAIINTAISNDTGTSNNISNVGNVNDSSPVQAIPLPTVNHPPVANAGKNQIVNENTTVILNGIATDADLNDNDKLTYLWKQTSGPAVALNDSNTENPTFIAPPSSSDSIVNFLLTAKDNKGAASNPDTVTIVVKHLNHAPGS